jgi:hypothetical protein
MVMVPVDGWQPKANKLAPVKVATWLTVPRSPIASRDLQLAAIFTIL